MNNNYYQISRKLASIAYSVGVISLIIGLLLSVVSQPVYASSQNDTATCEKVWICHVTPGNSHSVYVDANGWGGHSGHPSDFLLTGENDPRCGGDPTNTPKPTKTSAPTKVPPTDTQVPTKVPPTDTQVPTGVPPTDTQVPSEVPPTDTQVPTEVVLTETIEPTAEMSSTPEDTLTPDITETPTEAAVTPTVTEVPFKRLDVNYDCVGGQQKWTITNPNSTWVFTWWSFSDGSAYGGATIPANDTVSFYVANGYRTITVNWDERPGIQSLHMTTNPERTCSITITGTPTETPTELPTATETATATATATETAIPTATEIPFQRLNVGFDCVNGQQLWTITNPNPFPVLVAWSFSSGPGPGGATVPASSSINFYVAGGYRTITVTWNNGVSDQSLSLTTNPESPCAIDPTSIPTRNPKPKATGTEPSIIPVTGATVTPRPTFVSTIEAAVDAGQSVLIPVTGADFSNPFTNTPLNKLFLNLGFVFLGMAFLAHGISFKLK